MNVLEPADYNDATTDEVVADWQSRIAALFDSGAYATAHARLSESMEPLAAMHVLYGAAQSVIEDGPVAYRQA